MTKQSKFIRARWIIDGSGGPISENVLIKITDGKFESIDKTNHKEFILDKDKLINLSSHTILPCFVDSHVHLSLSGTQNKKIRNAQINSNFEYAQQTISSSIIKHLKNGVIAVRDGGDSYSYSLQYKLKNDKVFDKFHLKTAGKAFYRENRYGKMMGMPVCKNKTLDSEITREYGNDHVKIINSGLISLTKFKDLTQPQFTPQFSLNELKDAVKKAKKIKLKVMVHANGIEPVKNAIMAKCDSIEHGFFMGDKNLKLMAAAGTTWVPTAYTMKAYSEKSKKNLGISEVCKKNLEHQLKQIYQAKKYGVPIAVGTDAGCIYVDHGVSVGKEIGLLTDAGYSLQEAISCATYNGAKLLGIKTIGLIKKGMDANFIAIRTCPDSLIEKISKIEKIYIKGILITNS